MISIFSIFSDFQSWFCRIYCFWFYLCCSFKHSNWWCHKSNHTEYF